MLEIGGRDSLPHEVETETRAMLIEPEAKLAQRLDELDGVRPDAQIEAGPPATIETHGVLPTRDIEDRIAADHVAVRIDAQSRRKEQLFLRTERAYVVSVIPI